MRFRKEKVWPVALDRIGVTVSGLCAVHCAAVPLVFALPALQWGLHSFHSSWHAPAIWLLRLSAWEGVLVCLAMTVAVAAVLPGTVRGERASAFLAVLCGGALLGAAAWGPARHDPLWHALLAVAGVVVLATVHWQHLRARRMRERKTYHDS